ncbi:MAG: L-seryl-tRNA(Sec) selenium transferase [Bacillota bacterium]
MDNSWQKEALRRIPAVSRALQTETARALQRRYSAGQVSEALAQAAAELRQTLSAAVGPDDEAAVRAMAVLNLGPVGLAEMAGDILAREQRPSLRRVINGTGVVLHTNLGRSLLAPAAAQRVAEVAQSYSNLELDLETGERGSRYAHVESLLCRLTGAEAALVVNNNAGAVLLVLSALAQGREVVVSRGELIEIGGSFRIPDVMAQSGARLVEVGTTNKTHARDYERAITPESALLLKVHSSNYRILGFTAAVSREEMVQLARQRGLLAVEDLGSGVLVDDLPTYGYEAEPTAVASVRAGVDVVTFSGDKLLGGPQAGVIVGRREAVEKIRRHPLNRALRIDKLTLAALEETLRLYLDPRRAWAEVPTLRMLSLPKDELRRRAGSLARRLRTALGPTARVETVEGFSQGGGGSLPAVEIPTWLVALRVTGLSPRQVEERLRRGDPAVLVRIQHDQVLIDPRTLLSGDDADLTAALAAACGASG